MLRKLFIHCLAAVPLAGGASLAHAQSGQQAALEAGGQLGASAVVWGIISYTRWPQPPQPLRLCIIGHSAHGDALYRPSDWLGAERDITVHGVVTEHEAVGQCDVLYVGKLPPERLTALVKALTGKPILTIGEERDFCSFGGMFCLDGTAGGVRFAANLDAISRSGLRVNPQVLRLTRQLPNRP